MAKDLTKQADIQQSLDSQESSGGMMLKIPEGKTPVYFLSSAYEDGYIHWIDVPGAGRVRVVCAGGLEGKGFAPDTCSICAYCLSMYERAKQVSDPDKAQKLKNLGNDSHAKYEAQFVVAKGEMVKVKNEKGEKVSVADFDDATVGVLSMTGTQYKAFMALRDSEAYPFIKGTGDLLNRAILLDKAKRESGGKPAKYATIEFKPARNQMDKPSVQWKPEDFPLADNFQIDLEQVEKAYTALVGSAAKSNTKKIADDAYEAEEDLDDLLGDDDNLSDAGLSADDVDEDDFLADVDDRPQKAAPAKKAPAKVPEKKAPAKKTAPDDAEF